MKTMVPVIGLTSLFPKFFSQKNIDIALLLVILLSVYCYKPSAYLKIFS